MGISFNCGQCGGDGADCTCGPPLHSTNPDPECGLGRGERCTCEDRAEARALGLVFSHAVGCALLSDWKAACNCGDPSFNPHAERDAMRLRIRELDKDVCDLRTERHALKTELDLTQQALGEVFSALGDLTKEWARRIEDGASALPSDPYAKGLAVGRAEALGEAATALTHVLNRLVWLASEGQDERPLEPWEEAIRGSEIELPIGVPYRPEAISALLRRDGRIEEADRLRPWVTQRAEAFWAERLEK